MFFLNVLTVNSPAVLIEPAAPADSPHSRAGSTHRTIGNSGILSSKNFFGERISPY